MMLNTANKNQINFKAEIDDIINMEMIKKIFGDKQRFMQILMNFLSNAMKFTNKGGTITVAIKVIDQQLVNEFDTDKVEAEVYVNLQISIIDTGIGISKENLGKLFLDFGKLNDTANRNVTGTGLGLSICKRIIEKMGGSVNVVSKEGVGTEFKIHIKTKCLVNPDSVEILKLKQEEDLLDCD